METTEAVLPVHVAAVPTSADVGVAPKPLGLSQEAVRSHMERGMSGSDMIMSLLKNYTPRNKFVNKVVGLGQLYAEDKSAYAKKVENQGASAINQARYYIKMRFKMAVRNGKMIPLVVDDYLKAAKWEAQALQHLADSYFYKSFRQQLDGNGAVVPEHELVAYLMHVPLVLGSTPAASRTASRVSPAPESPPHFHVPDLLTLFGADSA